MSPSHLTPTITPTTTTSTGSDDSALTTDDLIPMFAYVVVQSGLQWVISNISYMREFMGDDLASEEEGFTLVTLDAAVQFLGSDELHHKVCGRGSTPSATHTTHTYTHTHRHTHTHAHTHTHTHTVTHAHTP